MNSWKVWLYGLFAAAIGGAATVATGFAAGAAWDVIWKQCLYRALFDVAMYLKSSPLPSLTVIRETDKETPSGTESTKSTLTVNK